MDLLIPPLICTCTDAWLSVSHFELESNATLFGCSNGSSAGLWKFSLLDPISLWHSPIIMGLVFLVALLSLFSTLSCFLALQWLQARLMYPTPQSWSVRVSHFSQPWFLSLGNNMRNQDLDTTYGCYNWDMSLCSQLVEPGDACVCTNPCISTYALRHLHVTTSMLSCI